MPGAPILIIPIMKQVSPAEQACVASHSGAAKPPLAEVHWSAATQDCVEDACMENLVQHTCGAGQSAGRPQVATIPLHVPGCWHFPAPDATLTQHS
jgi:hypothetical protein